MIALLSGSWARPMTRPTGRGRVPTGKGQRSSAGYLWHFMKWPLASRHIFGLAGHLTNLPFLSLHGAASAGADAPAIRLNADKASTNFFISNLPRHWVGKG